MVSLLGAIAAPPRVSADRPASLASPRARLVLSCDPLEALVSLQSLDVTPAPAPGTAAPPTPCGDELVVSPGRYRLLVKALGRRDYKEVLSLGAGLTHRQIDLPEAASVRLMGTLQVEISESPVPHPGDTWPLDSASSYLYLVDSEARSLAALQQGIELPPGRHWLTVIADRRPPSSSGSSDRPVPVPVYEQEVILPGPPVRLSLFSQLRVRHCPAGAHLHDGQSAHDLPTDDDVLVRPRHKYSITCRRGIREEVMTVAVEAGEVVELDFSNAPFDRKRGYEAPERGSPLSARVLSQSELAFLLSGGFPQHLRVRFALGLIDQPFRTRLTALELGVEAATRLDSLAAALSIRALIYERGRIALASSSLFGGSYEWSHGQSTVEQSHSFLFSYFPEHGPTLTLQPRLLLTGDRLCPDVQPGEGSTASMARYDFVPQGPPPARLCDEEALVARKLQRPELVNRGFDWYFLLSATLEQRLGRRFSLFLQVEWSPRESFGHPRRLWHPEVLGEGGGWERGWGVQAGLIFYNWRKPEGQ